jgi:hypothetical protein
MTFDLIVTLDKTFARLGAKPVSTLNVRDFAKFSRQIDRDFLDRAMPSKTWLPGAFQTFGPHKNELKVWPVKFPYPAMPPKVAIQPAPGSAGLKPIPEGSFRTIR